MTSPRLSMLMKFLSDDLALSLHEMTELRALLDAKIRQQGGALSRTTPARTLYLPSEPLDEL